MVSQNSEPTDVQTSEERAFQKILASLEKSVNSHKPGFDGWMYNGGTIVTLLLTAAVSVLSGKVIPIVYDWVPAVLSAFAGLFVALERSLGFGQRWRFHIEMRAGYTTVIDMIHFYFAIPESEIEQKAKLRNEIWQSINALRSRESAIPNSGGGVAAGT